MTKKKLTIIIPTYNSEKFIKNCLNSILKQTFKDFIVFIADGGSTDRTLEILNNTLSNYKIISQKDKCSEEGINKCFSKIQTKFFMIIGSDDFLGNKKYIENLFKKINKPGIDIVFPNLGVVVNKRKKIIKQPNNFSYLKYKTIVPGLGWLAKKKIAKINRFSCKLKVATDYDFFYRLKNKGINFFRDNKSVYYFRLGGHSFKNAIIGFKEMKSISLKNNGPKIKIYCQYFLTLIKFFIKFIILKKYHKIDY